MRERRGISVGLWPGDFGNMIDIFRVGDIVTPIVVNSPIFFGVVREVNKKTNKILVSWNGGSTVQHDPDEIMLHPEVVQESLYNRVNKLNGTVETVEEIKTASNFDNLISRRSLLAKSQKK